MASDKLKKYLAYYQKILREEPENIEARLRLAALFKEMGSKSHAIDEYVTASKLLAAQGLPLEAIAACKAVLELDPSHTEVQFFLARLFAQAPDALGRAARVAKPVGEPSIARPPMPAAHGSDFDPASMKLEVLDTDEMDAFLRSGEQPITLAQPKGITTTSEGNAFARDDEMPTGIHVSASLGDEPTQARERTSSASTRVVVSEPTEPMAQPQLPEITIVSPEKTRRAILDAHRATFVDKEATRVDNPLEFAASSDEIERARASISDDMRVTVAYEDLDDLRETQAFDPEELRALSTHKPPSSPSWQALDQTLHKHVSQELLDAMSRIPSSEDDTKEREVLKIEESFELNIFDLKSVELGEEPGSEIFGELDEIGSEVTEATESDITGVLPPQPTLVSVVRDDLPDIPLLSRLNQYAFVELLQRARMREVEADEVILSPGHQLKNLYITLSGAIAVSKRVGGAEVRLSTFKEGDFFGEFALLTGRDHSATVKAVKRSHLLEISEDLVHHIATYDEEIWDTLWDYYHARMLNNLMVSDNIFKHLGAAQRDEIIDDFELNEYEAGDVVLAPDVPCPFVCLVLFGVLQITPVNEDLPSKTLREGEFFGFVASLSVEPGQATIRAIKDVSLLCLPAAKFREIIRRNAGMSAEIRSLLRARVHRTDLFLTGMTGYAESGFSD